MYRDFGFLGVFSGFGVSSGIAGFWVFSSDLLRFLGFLGVGF